MGQLFPRICSIETLREAWKGIQLKGSRGGIDGVSIGQFSKDAESHLQSLAKTLQNNRYSPEPTERIHIPKFNTAGEFRPLSLPTIKDKIVQQAVRIVIEPFFERRFLNCSYAYRPQKGARKAIGRVAHYIANEKRNWAVFGDLDNFFDSLNHERLLQEVKKVIYEPEILALIRMWLKMGAFDERGRYHDAARGIAQGGIISPLLSNLFAHPLDEYVVAEKMAYVRYADNFVVLCRSREEAQQSLEAIETFVRDNLQLRLNHESEPVRDVMEQGFVFLGIEFRGRQQHLAAEKLDKIRRKIDWLSNKNRPHPVAKIVGELTETIDGVRRCYGFLEPHEDFHALDEHLQGRLRVLLRTKRDRGEITGKSELESLLGSLVGFAATEGKDLADFRKRLAQDAFRPGRELPDTNPPPRPEPSPQPDPPAPPAPAVGDAPWESTSVRGDTGEASHPDQAATAPPAPTDMPPAHEAEAAAASASSPQSLMPPGGAPSPMKSQEEPGRTANHDASEQETPVEEALKEPTGTAPADEAEGKSMQSADRKVAAKKRRYLRHRHLESEVVVTSPGVFIGHRGNRVVLFKDRKKLLERPLIKVRSVLIHSNGVTVSSDLVEACARAEIPIVFSYATGRSYAALHAPLQAKPELGLLQLEALQNGTGLEWAKALVLGKLKNQLNLLKFYLRHREEVDPDYAQKMEATDARLEKLQNEVKALKAELPYEKQRNTLFALEGQGGAAYWEMVRLLLPPDIPYPGRVRQGATDLVNAMLNFGYSLLYPRIERALLLAGLNLYASFLHVPQAGKPTLSFDFIEPFRAPVVDRAILSMLTRGRDLNVTSEGRLSAESVKMVIEAVVSRLGTLVPYSGEKATLEQVISKQACLLAGSLRREKKYKAFVSRY